MDTDKTQRIFRERIKNQIVECVANSNFDSLDDMVEIVVMSEEAKQLLRDKGYGWTGLNLLETCKLVPNLPYYS